MLLRHGSIIVAAALLLLVAIAGSTNAFSFLQPPCPSSMLLGRQSRQKQPRSRGQAYAFFDFFGGGGKKADKQSSSSSGGSGKLAGDAAAPTKKRPVIPDKGK